MIATDQAARTHQILAVDDRLVAMGILAARDIVEAVTGPVQVRRAAEVVAGLEPQVQHSWRPFCHLPALHPVQTIG